MLSIFYFGALVCKGPGEEMYVLYLRGLSTNIFTEVSGFQWKKELGMIHKYSFGSSRWLLT